MFSKTHLSILSVFGKVNCLPIFVSTYCPRKLGHRIIIYRFCFMQSVILWWFVLSLLCIFIFILLTLEGFALQQASRHKENEESHKMTYFYGKVLPLPVV